MNENSSFKGFYGVGMVHGAWCMVQGARLRGER
jgi:hypothetical protein